MHTVPLSSARIALHLNKNSAIGEPAIEMVFDDQRIFVMLTAKRNLLATKLIHELRLGYHADILVGMAFDLRRSVEESKLVLYDDPNVNGVYVPLEDACGHMRDMFNK